MAGTNLRHFERLSRLTLLVMLLNFWLFWTGVRTIKYEQRHRVDRHDRRYLSVFQIGWRWIDRVLTNEDPLPKALQPIELLKV